MNEEEYEDLREKEEERRFDDHRQQDIQRECAAENARIIRESFPQKTNTP